MRAQGMFDRPLHCLRHGLALLFLVALTATAARAQFTRFQNYADEQGLDNLDVTAIAQDRAGYILFGTQGGLYRFDGTSIAAYGHDSGLPSLWIRQIAIDRNGRTWVVAREGVFVRQGADFVRVSASRFQDMEGPRLLTLGGDGGTVVAIDDGMLLAAPVTPHGVGVFAPLLDAGTVRAHPELAHAGFVVSDGNGFLVGCGTMVCRIADGQVSVMGRDVGLVAEPWEAALRTKDGTLWLRSLHHLAWQRPNDHSFGIAEVPGRGSTYYAGGPEDLGLVADDHGRIYTQGENGLLVWSHWTWRRIAPHAGGLSSNPVQTLFLDREGSLWAGTDGTGVFRSLGLGRWEHWTTDDGLPGNVVWSTVRLAGGQFWAATYGGTARLGGSPMVIPGTDCALAATQGGRIWIAPFGAPLLRYDPATGATERIAPVGTVRTALVDKEDRLWLSTRAGLVVVPDADAPVGTLRPKVVLTHSIRQVAIDPSGVPWAVGQDGLFRLGGGLRFDPVVSHDMLGAPADGMAFAPDGTVWVVTEADGVKRFRIGNGQATALPPIMAPVLASNGVMSVFRDHRDWMWVSTDHGIDMFDGRSWHRFDSTSGPIVNDMDAYSVHEDTDGSMWFGTTRGLSHLLDPADLPASSVLHPVITAVSLGKRSLPPARPVKIGWSAKPLAISFTDLDYAQGRGIAFRYRLSGVDADWTSTTAREIRYASLPVGTLRFELVATDATHGLLSDPVGFSLRITAPWWRRHWFYALCVLAMAALVAAAWQLRIRLLVHQKRRLEDIVSARTAEIERTRTEMQRLAMSDALTGLANRRAIMDTLTMAVGAALRAQAPLGLLLCDIDHFKLINDTFGHLGGDVVLTTFGRRLAASVGPDEAVGRFGGEEFLLVLPGAPELVAQRAAAIQFAIAGAPYVIETVERRVTSSGGLAFLRPDDDAVSFLARADAALYAAKEKGRNRIEREAGDRSWPVPADRTRGASASRSDPNCDKPTEVEKQFQARRELERDLCHALERGEFSLVFQPVVNTDTDTVTACEALLRWRSPSRGPVPPAEFIPFAETVGLMPAIGSWVLGQALREARTWPGTPKVSVNLSPAQFRMPNLVEEVSAALAVAGLPPERLELEVTETAMIDDMGVAADTLRRLAALGVSIALDDFGTGYSSLSVLRTLPFNRIKIDRSFVQDLCVKPEAEAIVRAVIGLCDRLGAAITAEGVESDRQLAQLGALGCVEIQGYLFSHPCAALELRTWLSGFAASRAVRPADGGMPGRQASSGR